MRFSIIKFNEGNQRSHPPLGIPLYQPMLPPASPQGRSQSLNIREVDRILWNPWKTKTYALYPNANLTRVDASYNKQNVICAIALVFQNVTTNTMSTRFIGNFCGHTSPVSAQSIQKILIGGQDKIQSIQFESSTGVKSKLFGVETDSVRTVELAENERIAGVEGYQQNEESSITGIRLFIVAK